MESIAAALRTKNSDELTWEYVTTTMIDEYDARKKNISNINRSNNKHMKNWRGHDIGIEMKLEDGTVTNNCPMNIGLAARALAAALNGRSGNS